MVDIAVEQLVGQAHEVLDPGHVALGWLIEALIVFVDPADVEELKLFNGPR